MGLPSHQDHKARSNSAAVYVRHRPETTLLYQIVQEYWPEFQAELASKEKYLPAYITKEFNEFMKCGILEHGFLRIQCEAWPSMIRQLATRAGLVLSGQIAGAVQATLRARQWKGHVQDKDTLSYMAKLPEVGDLLQFAISDDYLALRHGCGLEAKARRVG